MNSDRQVRFHGPPQDQGGAHLCFSHHKEHGPSQATPEYLTTVPGCSHPVLVLSLLFPFPSQLHQEMFIIRMAWPGMCKVEACHRTINPPYLRTVAQTSASAAQSPPPSLVLPPRLWKFEIFGYICFDE